MNTKSNKIISILMLLAGSLLVGFSAGRWLAPLAAWIGPVLIMRYARDHRIGRGYLLVLAAYILAFSIGFGSMWYISWGFLGMSALSILYGLLWSLPFLADRLVSPRLKGFSSTSVYPLAAATIEFLNIYTNPVGTWGATGFTQYGNLPLMQFASITGMIGITFLMGWFASVSNWAWENRARGGQVLRGAGVFGAVLAGVYIFGFLRLNLSPSTETDETIRVAGITAETQTAVYDQVGGMMNWIKQSETGRLAVQTHWDAYFDETVREAQAGARLVIWPEIAGLTYNSEVASLTARAQEVASQNKIYLAVPLAVFYPPDTGQPFENRLLLIDPSGKIVLDHVKYGGAISSPGMLVGDGILQTVDTPFGVLSGVICWDQDYPAVIRQAGQNGTGLMLVPSYDWMEIDPIHTNMAVFRAIENGMSLVRQTDAGLSIAVDPYGRVLAQTDFFGATDRTMVAQVPVKHVTTVYTLFGRYFEWVCLAGFLYIIARAASTRRPVK
jgi:apolipoprotein N-acyltransferase